MNFRYYWDLMSLKIVKVFNKLFPYEKDPLMHYKIYCLDEQYASHSLIESIDDLYKSVDYLREKVSKLEEENVGLTNELYEIYNKIDSQVTTTQNLSKFSLGE